MHEILQELGHFPGRIRSVSRRTLQVSFTVSFLYEFCLQFYEAVSYSDPCWSKLTKHFK